MGHETTITNGYNVSVNGGSSTSLTYDLNGNMTSDGTNSFAWDAANRMTKITYPGTNNFSSFVYDGLGRNVSIVETTAGSITSTKQFVWSSDKLRPYQPCEARNASGTITAQYFTSGQTISGTSYFYTADHLANPPDLASHFMQANVGPGLAFSPIFTSSIREMTNSGGSIQAQLSYDLYGRVTQLQGSLSPDFQFGDYYFHAPSGLNLTLTRAYSSSQGRFINRDRVGETGGQNLYAYMSNHPEVGVDPDGKCALAIPIIIALSPGEAAALGGIAAGAAAGTAWAAGQIVGGYINNMSGGDNVIIGPWPNSGTNVVLGPWPDDPLRDCITGCIVRHRGSNPKFKEKCIKDCICKYGG